MPTEIRSYVRSLGIDAYVVGGAVRDELLGLPHADEDFLVPGVDQAGLRALLEPHGRVEDMEVHGQLVGVRLFPRDRAIRALAPAGIELTPPRAERSTGPGPPRLRDRQRRRRSGSRRTWRAGTSRSTRWRSGSTAATLRRPVRRRRRPRAARRSAPSARRASTEDPLRLVRALRFVSQLGFDLAPETVAQMRGGRAGPRARLGRADRRRDQGRRAGRALEAPARTRARAGAAPRARHRRAHRRSSPSSRPRSATRSTPERQPLPLDEHIFAVVQNAADAGATPRGAARLPAPRSRQAAGRRGRREPRGRRGRARRPHPEAAALSDARPAPRRPHRRRPRVPARRADRRARRAPVPGRARRRAGRRPDQPQDGRPRREARSRRTSSRRSRGCGSWSSEERSQPHRIADLAVTGDDLRAIGFDEGPELGRVLQALLDDVVDDPARNDRAWLLERAARELP